MSARDSYASAWYKSFPYADENDPANRSIFFNDQKYPYNLWQVRWALALSINLPQVTLSYGGMLRASVLPFAATDIAEKTMYAPLQSWMTNFALPDGFRPYDPNFASKLVTLLKQRGFQGLPTDPARISQLFGPGYFKYDAQEAAKLLKSVGFKFSAGTWLLPNGNPWTINVNAPANFEPESGNQGFAIANQWKQFGINAVAQGMDSSTFWTNFSNGTYDAGAYWSVAFLTPDSSDQLTQFDQKYITPTGKPATSNQVRWRNAEASRLVEQMQQYAPEDPRTIQLGAAVHEDLLQGYAADPDVCLHAARAGGQLLLDEFPHLDQPVQWPLVVVVELQVYPPQPQAHGEIACGSPGAAGPGPARRGAQDRGMRARGRPASMRAAGRPCAHQVCRGRVAVRWQGGGHNAVPTVPRGEDDHVPPGGLDRGDDGLLHPPAAAEQPGGRDARPGQHPGRVHDAPGRGGDARVAQRPLWR